MMNLNQIKQKLTNFELVGLTIFGEARNQSIEGRIAVGCVIRNRLQSKENFGGTTYKDICLAKNQFSCWFEQGPNYDTLERAVQMVLDGKLFSDSLIKECLWIGQGITDNHFRDNVNGACYYRTVNLMREKPFPVAWHIEIGDHIFYKSV